MWVGKVGADVLNFCQGALVCPEQQVAQVEPVAARPTAGRLLHLLQVAEVGFDQW